MDDFTPKRKIPAHSLKVRLWLRVENDNKYVRGRKRTIEEIEQFCLSHYDMKKPDKDGWEYELVIPYENEKDLDRTIYDLLSEMESIAERHCCFTESDVVALDGSERSW